LTRVMGGKAREEARGVKALNTRKKRKANADQKNKPEQGGGA